MKEKNDILEEFEQILRERSDPKNIRKKQIEKIRKENLEEIIEDLGLE